MQRKPRAYLLPRSVTQLVSHDDGTRQSEARAPFDSTSAGAGLPVRSVGGEGDEMRLRSSETSSCSESMLQGLCLASSWAWWARVGWDQTGRGVWDGDGDGMAWDGMGSDVM